MDESPERVHVRVDPYTRVCLTVIAVLLTVLIVGMWSEAVPVAREAAAVTGIPDSGRQRDKMIKELEKQTATLDRLVRLFESGTAKVQVKDAGGKQAGKNVAAPDGPK